MATNSIPLNQLADSFSEPIDFFICCASFETRSYTVAATLRPGQVKTAIICGNDSLKEKIGNNLSKLQSYFESSRLLALQSSDPVRTEVMFSNVLNKKPAGSVIYLVDISTFTRENLLILLCQLKAFAKPTDKVFFAYIGAAKYALDSEHDAVWLSKGVIQTRSVLGFPGDPSSGDKIHLIILAGFESDRAIELIDEYEPSVLSIGYGPEESSIRPEHCVLNKLFHEKIAALYPNVRIFEFPPNDAMETANIIQVQASSIPSTRVVVAPLNTKLSTVGAAISAFRDPTIQLCYAEAAIYNYTNYCEPEDKCYLFTLDGLIPSIS